MADKRYYSGSLDGKRPPTRDPLKGARERYDVVVIGSGLAGLTAANILGRAGHSVCILEQHYNYGGMATWFKRKGGHIFDVSLHGFPVGMIKTCRKYWGQHIADMIVQLDGVRFDNPQFQFDTTFTREDFTDKLVTVFGCPLATVEKFYDTLRRMNYYDDDGRTTGELFEEFFPGRNDIHRLLMEPISYANGSSLDDPAISYGIVFSNFMSKGVFTFTGGTDRLIGLMRDALAHNGVDVRVSCDVSKIHTSRGRASGVAVGGRTIEATAVVSNGNLLRTIFDLVGEDKFDRPFVEKAKAVRLNNSSTQVYMALKPEETIDESTGDLLFTSTAPVFQTDLLLSRDVTSRTYSFYYPRTRPGAPPRHLIVASTNANYHDWADLPEDEYRKSKQDLIETTLDAADKYVPNIRERLAHVEAATPVTFQRYTKHALGSSFGTKFEGLEVSRAIPSQVSGLYHAGSVGIIMSGWLGAINYGVIVANGVDSYLTSDQVT